MQAAAFQEWLIYELILICSPFLSSTFTRQLACVSNGLFHRGDLILREQCYDIEYNGSLVVGPTLPL